MNKKHTPAPPKINVYFFPVVLALLGLWCFYDGWLTTNPEMKEHLLFNRILSGILLLWALIDFIRTRRFISQKKSEDSQKDSREPDDN